MAAGQVNDDEFTVERREAWPANLLIKIENFSLISKYGIKEYESREFDAGNHKWRLIIYPDGDEGQDSCDHVSVHLVMVGASSLPLGFGVKAVFSVFLYDQINDNFLCFRGKVRCFNPLKSKWGFSKLTSKKSLMDPSNGFIVDHNCTFGAEVFVIDSHCGVLDCLSVKDKYAVMHTWKISNFSKVESKSISSEVFGVGGFKWKTLLS